MPGQPPADPKMQRLLDFRGGKGRHSTLYAWMRDNREALAADFARNGPQWAERVKLMGEAGLLDRTGKPPTVRGAMQTWYRMCRATKGTAPAPAATAPTPAPAPMPGGTVPPPRAPDPSPRAIHPEGRSRKGSFEANDVAEGRQAPAVDTDNPYGFRTAGGAKDWTKKGPE